MAFKAHDVRRMHTCFVCGDIGMHEPGQMQIPLLVKTEMDGYAHPDCLPHTYLFLSVSRAELAEIRRSDVSPRIFRELIKHLGRV